MILRPGEAGVAHRAADDEAPGRVDEQARAQGVGVVEVGGEDGDDDVLPEVVADHGLRALAVLAGDEDALDGRRPAVDVADGDLRLAVRAQVVQRAGLADRGQPPGQLVGQRDRQRHELGRLVGGVAEHHALVAGAGVAGRVRGAVDPLRDVGRLLVDRVDDRAGVGAEAEVGVDVADLADRLARHVLDVDVGRGRDLARHDHEPGVHQRLARHAPERVLGHHRVEDAVGDLVGDLVRVALGDRLGGEQELGGVRHVGVTSSR